MIVRSKSDLVEECLAHLIMRMPTKKSQATSLRSKVSSRRSLSTQEILMGPEQALRCDLFRDSNMNADDIMFEEEGKGKA